MRTSLLALGLSLLLSAPAPAREPGACPADGDLDYYRCRAEDSLRREPGGTPPDYYLAYGDRYVRRFSELTRPLLSPAGQAWLDRVRVGLQQAIEARRARDPAGFAALERDREAFLDFAYDTHPEAYLAAGLSRLPVRDLVVIGSTPDLQDLLSARGRRQLHAVLRALLGACADQGLGRCAVSGVLRELRAARHRLSQQWRGRSHALTFWLARRLVGSALRQLDDARRRGEGGPAPAGRAAVGAAGSLRVLGR